MTAYYTQTEERWTAENVAARQGQVVFHVTVNEHRTYRWIAGEFNELVSESGACIWKIEYNGTMRPTGNPVSIIVVRKDGKLWWPNYLWVWWDDRSGHNWVTINGIDQRADQRS